MKPSNTSPSEMSFGGVLQPLVELLAQKPRQSGRLVGQDVVLPRSDLSAIIAVDSQDDIHLLIAPVAGDDARYSRLDLRGLKISERDWSVAGRPSARYLDVSCSTGASPSFRRPFLRFAEDVLQELSALGAPAADAVYRTGLRWRRFWSADPGALVTTEWVHGIFGELSFLVEIIDRFGPPAVRSWAGPLGRPHDFQVGTAVAVEVKTSVVMPFTIHCTIEQLDPTIFGKLYLVCYRITRSDSGEALPMLVARIEARLRDEEPLLDAFYAALTAAGYRRELESVYAELRFDRSALSAFAVNDSFPKITQQSFSGPLDHRISNVRYMLQITGINDLSLDSIAADLVRLAEA